MPKRGPISGKDALGVSLLAGLLATVDEVIEGIVRCPSVALFGSAAMSDLGVRRAKAALSSGCKSHPAIAPAGSNRSSHGGNEVAEAFD
jgi:hypothetical protein